MEHSTDPLPPLSNFILRMVQRVGAIMVLIALSLVAGVAGYQITEHMSFVDAFYNASMILGGMGPANELHTAAGKFFASFYALYSGLFVIASMGILLVPVFHRVLHKFHVQQRKP